MADGGPCVRCGGSGIDPSSPSKRPMICPRCGGSGREQVPD